MYIHIHRNAAKLVHSELKPYYVPKDIVGKLGFQLSAQEVRATGC